MPPLHSPALGLGAAGRRPSTLSVALVATLGASLLGGTVRGDSTDKEPTSPPFGFSKLEIFKVDDRTVGLQTSDINGDGRQDLVLANNAEASIWFLIQRSEEEMREALESDADGGSKELNRIGSDPRFRVEKFYTEKMIKALAVGDFDGDGKPDVAYHADPPALHVVYQHGAWGSEKTEFPIRDGSNSPYALRAADVDADGRTDLLFLGARKIYVFRQSTDGRGEKSGLLQPETIHNANAEIFSIDPADLDGDGDLDLLVSQPRSRESLLLRLGGKLGLGPEIAPTLRPIRGWAVAPLAFPRDEKPQPSIITIGSSDGRVAIHRLSEKKTDGSLGSARLLPLGGDGGTRIIGDLDRDGRLDHISSDLDAARLRVRFQDEDGSFSRQDDFPTYSGVNGLACASVDLEPGAEIVVISRKEQAIGVASWKDGRLYFPQTLRLPAEIGTDFRPLLLGAETRKRGEGTNERATLFVVTEGESSSHHLVLLEADGEDARLVSRTKLETGGTAPNAMRVFDANGDGLADVLLFVPYSDPFLYLQEEAKETIAEAAGETKTGATGDAGEKSTAAASESAATNDTKASDSNADSASIRFVEVSRGRDFGRGQLAELRPESFDVMPSSDGKAPIWIITSKRYVRLLRLTSDRRLEVLDQIGGERAGTEYITATTSDLDGDGKREVIVLDRATASVEILAATENGTYKLSRTKDIPAVDPSGLGGYDFDGDGRGDLLVRGKSADAVLLGRSADTTLEEVLTWAIDDKKDLGAPSDAVIGDFNGDGKSDVVLVTAPRYHIIFLETALEERSDTEANAEPRPRLKQRLAFPIFEEKSYMRGASHMGPRVLLAEDIDGDALDDLVLLIHDRILLYLQDRGASSPEGAKLGLSNRETAGDSR